MSEITQTKQIADLDAKFYVGHSELQHHLSDLVLKNLQFFDGARILDVGCGDGSITASLAEKNKKGSVVGIDLSSSMISHASETYSGLDHQNLSFSQVKAEDYTSSEKFDYIVSFSCFHWVREGEQALQNLANLLKPGGELVLLTYPKESCYYEFMQEALETFPSYKKQSAYNTMLSIKEYKKYLIKNGLSIETFEITEKFTEYDTEQENKDFIEGWLVSFVPLPNKSHKDYLDEVFRAATPYTEYSNSKVKLPYTEIVIKAKKK